MHAVRQIERLTAEDRTDRRRPRAAEAEAAGLRRRRGAHENCRGPRAISASLRVPMAPGAAAWLRTAHGSTLPMKLTIERAALLRSLAHVQNVVERRTTIPILSNVKLAADGDRLGLTATDMDLSLVAHEAGAGRPSAAPRPWRRTRCSTSSASCRTAARSASSRRRRRRGDACAPARSVFNLPTLPADEFPAIGEEQLGVPVSHAGRPTWPS